MGTRGNVVVKHTSGDDCCNIYHHMDSYPEGLGKTLAEFLLNIKMVNGLGTVEGKIANGMDCLTAQIIKHLKDGPGMVYVQPTTWEKDNDFTYTIELNGENQLTMRVQNWDDLVFLGTPAEFMVWLDPERP